MLETIEIIRTVHKHSNMTTLHGGGNSNGVLEIVPTFLARIVLLMLLKEPVVMHDLGNN